VIAENHATLALFFRQRADEKVFTNLYFRRAKRLLNFTPGGAVKNVPAFDANDLAFGDWIFGKQAAAVNETWFHEGFWSNIG
jgi:hypothetical protein